MAKINTRASRRNPPGKTKNGKLKLRPLSISQLEEMVAKANRPRDKDKWQRAIQLKAKKLAA